MLSRLLDLPRDIRCCLNAQKHKQIVLTNAGHIKVIRILIKKLKCGSVDQYIWVSLNTSSIGSRREAR